MGWSYNSKWKCAKDVHQAVLRHFPSVIASASVEFGRRLWVAHRYAVEEEKVSRLVGSIHLVLVRRDEDGEWGYKMLSEMDGPFYWDCPLRLLDGLSAPENERASKWRQEVRAYAEERRKPPAGLPPVGSPVLVHGRPYILGERHNRGKALVHTSEGRTFTARIKDICLPAIAETSDCEPR